MRTRSTLKNAKISTVPQLEQQQEKRLENTDKTVKHGQVRRSESSNNEVTEFKIDSERSKSRKGMNTVMRTVNNSPLKNG